MMVNHFLLFIIATLLSYASTTLILAGSKQWSTSLDNTYSNSTIAIDIDKEDLLSFDTIIVTQPDVVVDNIDTFGYDFMFEYQNIHYDDFKHLLCIILLLYLVKPVTDHLSKVMCWLLHLVKPITDTREDTEEEVGDEEEAKDDLAELEKQNAEPGKEEEMKEKEKKEEVHRYSLHASYNNRHKNENKDQTQFIKYLKELNNNQVKGASAKTEAKKKACPWNALHTKKTQEEIDLLNEMKDIIVPVVNDIKFSKSDKLGGSNDKLLEDNLLAALREFDKSNPIDVNTHTWVGGTTGKTWKDANTNTKAKIRFDNYYAGKGAKNWFYVLASDSNDKTRAHIEIQVIKQALLDANISHHQNSKNSGRIYDWLKKLLTKVLTRKVSSSNPFIAAKSKTKAKKTITNTKSKTKSSKESSTTTQKKKTNMMTQQTINFKPQTGAKGKRKTITTDTSTQPTNASNKKQKKEEDK